MSRIPIIILLLMFIVTKHRVASIADMIGNVQAVANFANDAISFFKDDLPIENLLMGSTEHALDQIIEKMDDISDTLTQMEANNDRRISHIINTVMQKLPYEDRVDTGINELHSYIVRIDGLYEDFNHYVKDRAIFNNKTVSKFIQAITSNKKGDLPDILSNLYHLMMIGRSGGCETGLLEFVQQKYSNQAFQERCNSGNSVQQRLYQIYSTAVMSEFRAFAMTVFSYALLMTYENVTFSAEMKKAAAQLISRSEDYIVASQKAMENSSTVIERCDAELPYQGENYFELEGAMQMIAVGESDVSNDGTCNGSCEDILSLGFHGCNYNENWCPRRQCHGHVYGCKSIESPTICELPADWRRRFLWVKDSCGNYYGQPSSCPGNLKYPATRAQELDSCDICLCNCAEEMAATTAVRSLSLRPVMAAIKANMVVIGIGFKSADKLIQIRIKEGELLPGGRIRDDSVRWVECENFEYEANGWGGEFYHLTGIDKIPMKINEDYGYIRYYNKRIHLDDIEAPFGYVVTGVKFEHSSLDPEHEWNEKPFDIAIHVTKFDFDDGTLYTDEDSSFWIMPQNMTNPSVEYSENRKPVNLIQPDDPSQVSGHTLVSGPNRIIEFQPSDRSIDAGQSTVPFFDGLKVEASPNSPLSGVGLYHRGREEGSGGYLAFRIMTLNIPGYLNTESIQDMI